MLRYNILKSAKVGLVAAAAGVLVLVLGSSIIIFAQGKGKNPAISHTSSVSQTEKKPSPTPTPTTPLIQQPLFFDNFVDASKGWSLGRVTGYTRLIENNTLTLADANHTILTESLPANTTFNDFAVTVSFTLLQASRDDSVGLYLRGDSNLDHDYRLDIYGNNTFEISKEFLDTSKVPQVKVLVNPSSASTLNAVGQQNTITLMMKGSILVLLINGTVTSTVIDTDYTSGQIALFVQNSGTSSGVEASFSSVVVYPAPDQLPSN
jgi:hypothetical protein